MNRERGLAVSVEAAVILPALVLFTGLLITLARVALAEQAIGSAAGAAARAATLSSSGLEARARTAAADALEERQAPCRSTTVSVTLRTEAGRHVVRVRVACTVDLADVSLPLIPGSMNVSAERASPVDPLRSG